MNGAVRLVNGGRPSEGSVQICVDGVWGHVCGYYYLSTTTFNNARVVCRQLGYSTSCKLIHTIDTYMVIHKNTCNYPLTVYSPSTSSLFNGGSQQPIIYGRMSCNGSEQTLSNCSKDVNYDSWYCQHYKLGVICEGK